MRKSLYKLIIKLNIMIYKLNYNVKFVNIIVINIYVYIVYM